jgi:hypothetical protein
MQKLNTKWLIIILTILLVLLVAGYIVYLAFFKPVKTTATSTTVQENIATVTESPSSPTVSTIDHTKLPLGDNKTTTSPKVGYVYSCQTSFNGGGAFTAGPWINQSTKTWNLNEKVTVDGSVKWDGAWSVSSDGTTRTLKGNGLPDHITGTYPISSKDDAYLYDRNPNSIKSVALSISLPTNPVLLSAPECVGGEVGVMLSGVPLFNAFDAGGRDAVAMEVQDNCEGHPQAAGEYHYHGPSDCLKDNTDAHAHSDLEGYAFDGFGIYGIKGENGVELSSSDLDECHGHTHEIMWDGKLVSMYHYHLTHDFPYSVGCFRAKKAVTAPLSSGEPALNSGGNRPPGR